MLVFALIAPITTLADYGETPETATPVTYTLSVNEQNYQLSVYAIDGDVYFKWRDIAVILSKTAVNFQIEWLETERVARITTDKLYTKIGGELEKRESLPEDVLPVPTMYIDGHLNLDPGYLIGGNTYQKLDVIVESIDISPDKLAVSLDSRFLAASIDGVRTQDYVGEDEFSLTLRADTKEALLNGEKHYLSASPFLKKDTFYIPLESVTKLLGGDWSFEDNTAKTELFGVLSEYRIGSHTIVRDGETLEIAGDRRSFNTSGVPIPVDEEFVPVIVDGEVYIPYDFSEFASPRYTKSTQKHPELGMVIMGSFRNELGVEEIKVGYVYDYISDDIKSELSYGGVAGEVINYDIEKYFNKELEVFVMRSKSPDDDLEGMDGKVCAIKVTGIRFKTPRGLRIGDLDSHAIALYGDLRVTLNMVNELSCEIVGGIVTSISFSSRYYTP